MIAFLKNWALILASLFMLVSPQIDSLFKGGEEAFFENWSADREFSADYAVELEKDPNRDFVILNLTDIQLGKEALWTTGAKVRENTDRLVREVKPDLITVSGDNADTRLAYIQMITMLDSYGIPWAPIMGNHDGQGCPSEFWCAYNFTKARNCLFKFGPEGMGYGNYVINIKENGRIIHTLFMMDTHSNIEEDSFNGAAGSGYDHLWPNQFEWYSWAVDGIAALAGKTVESTVIFHIPLREYKIAWFEATGNADWEADHHAPYVGEYAATSFGFRGEEECSAPENNGFFDLLKEKGSTKNVICGHDHVNDYSIVYQGIRLTYSAKDGPGCYWDEETNGGTVITVNSDGNASVEHHLIDFPD